MTALVTGASSGIGAATARGLAREGARVIGGARRVERIETDVALELDVTDPASCERFVDAAGPADILVNAAGLALGRAPFTDSTEEDERTVFETNVNGLVRMTRLVLERSLREPGHIVNIGSSPAAGRTRTARPTSRPSSRCTASRARCAKTCSAATSASRPSTPASSRRSSRSCASGRRREAKAVYEGIAAAERRGRRRVHPLRAHAARRTWSSTSSW